MTESKTFVKYKIKMNFRLKQKFLNQLTKFIKQSKQYE